VKKWNHENCRAALRGFGIRCMVRISDCAAVYDDVKGSFSTEAGNS
jgi:hypothetical protein